jgi:hypothetical protein
VVIVGASTLSSDATGLYRIENCLYVLFYFFLIKNVLIGKFHGCSNSSSVVAQNGREIQLGKLDLDACCRKLVYTVYQQQCCLSSSGPLLCARVTKDTSSLVAARAQRSRGCARAHVAK